VKFVEWRARREMRAELARGGRDQRYRAFIQINLIRN